ncbi:F-box/kelch-repeat protein at3g23880 [Phtheirospermum japonicum]|uniref:F-box/kelch-repeat protein at3g23880 n=1 Tax=Phtheirospermum japonicum TaxID=374723 RepID=A0A830D957_9LAMI|nr:F-box/kelch-repeat protein at3g23880 [Phtheirospermum japonicum]
MEGSNRNPPNSPTRNRSKKTKTTVEALSDRETLDLPPEILIEILARLPVKSLLRFKCVSKSWLSLISSPQFIKTHLKISTQNPNLSSHRLMLTICNPDFDLIHCSVQSLMFGPLTVAHNIDYPKKNPHCAVWIVGSCNGLICVAIDENDMFLWNPTTRTSRKLPPVAVKLRQGFYYIWGFGYDESSDDYKVVGVFCVFGNEGLYESVVKIYSLRADSWKSIEGFEGGVPLDDSATRGGSEFKWNIVSLDLRTEDYGTVEQPDYGEGCFDSYLGVLGEGICVLCNYEKVRADLWVMKEYGVKESWTKVVSIPYDDDPAMFLCSVPLWILDDGEILLALGTELVVYSPRDNCYRYPETSNVAPFLEADMYVESLVSV